jgi:hypothetical protein
MRDEGRWRLGGTLALGAGLAAVALAAVACGGGGDDGAPPGAPGATSTGGATATATAAAATPDDLASELYEATARMRAEVDTLLRANVDTPADVLGPLVAGLKERYITEFVAIGWRREALDAAGRAAFDSAFLRLLAANPQPDLEPYNVLTRRLDAERSPVAREVASLNILTQYAFFDLLRRQEPAEADRLGVP